MGRIGNWRGVTLAAMVIFSSLVFGLGATAQPSWSHTYPGAKDSAFYGMEATPDGGYIGSGWTEVLGAATVDGLLVRLDCTGAVVWQKTYGGPGDEAFSKVLPLRDGGFVVLGYTTSYGQGDLDVWVLRLDASGVPIWQRTYGGTGYDWAGNIALTPDGGYAFAGETESFGAGQEDLWLVKLDGEGHILWQKTYGGAGDDYRAALAALPDGGFLLSGTTGSMAPQRVACVLRLDSSGGIVWQNRYSAPGQETFVEYNILSLPAGGSLFVGDNYEGGGGVNPWLVRLDDAGGIVWQKAYVGDETDYFYGAAPTLDGGFALAGSTYSFGAGEADIWAMRVDPSGNILWQMAYGKAGWDLADDIASSSDGGFLMAGRLSEGASQNPWAIKVAQDGSMDGSCPFSSFTSAAALVTTAVATPTSFSPVAGAAVEGTTSVPGVPSGGVDTVQCASIGNCMLSCTATVPATADPGSPVSFSATATPEYCPGLATFLWHFGDGTNSTSQNPDYSYSAAGNYTWDLTVTTDGQTCVQTGTVAVSGGATPPSIASMTKMGGPFRIVVRGSGLQNGVSVFIDGMPWSNLVFTNAGLLKIKGGASLKAVVPKGVTRAFRFVNPDGGETTANWSW